MTDPTIPRHRLGGRRRGPTYGWFVDLGSRIVLRDNRGVTYQLPRVNLLSGTWGFDREGCAKLPRPFKYDSHGNVEVEGDQVVIWFIDGHPSRPLVQGGVRKLAGDDYYPRLDADDADPNRLAARVVPLDDDGEEAGLVRLEVAADGVGSLSAHVSDTWTLTVGDDDDPAVTWTMDSDGNVSWSLSADLDLDVTGDSTWTTDSLTVTSSAIKLGSSSASDYVALASLVKAELDAIWSAISANASHTHSVTTAPGTTAPPSTWSTGSASSPAASKVTAE